MRHNTCYNNYVASFKFYNARDNFELSLYEEPPRILKSLKGESFKLSHTIKQLSRGTIKPWGNYQFVKGLMQKLTPNITTRVVMLP
jgi:hypothetical protein